jgi:hypothetical protein
MQVLRKIIEYNNYVDVEEVILIRIRNYFEFVMQKYDIELVLYY